MATKSAGSSDFLNNLGRVYGIYTGGFLAFVILLAVLEQMGVPNRILGYLFVFFTISRLRHHRRSLANGAGFRILRRRPQRAGLL